MKSETTIELTAPRRVAAPSGGSAHGVLHHSARISNWRDLKPGVRVEWDALKVPHCNEYLRVKNQGTVVACKNQPGGIAVKPDKSEHEAIIWWLDNLRVIAPNAPGEPPARERK